MGTVNVNGPGYTWGPWFHNRWGDGTCVREGRDPNGELVYDLHSIINGDDRCVWEVRPMKKEGKVLMVLHVKDGLVAERLEDGSVRLAKLADPKHARAQYGPDWEVVIDDVSWRSLVCAVSKYGEDSYRFFIAGAFHNGSLTIKDPESLGAAGEVIRALGATEFTDERFRIVYNGITREFEDKNADNVLEAARRDFQITTNAQMGLFRLDGVLVTSKRAEGLWRSGEPLILRPLTVGGGRA